MAREVRCGVADTHIHTTTTVSFAAHARRGLTSVQKGASDIETSIL